MSTSYYTESGQHVGETSAMPYRDGKPYGYRWTWLVQNPEDFYECDTFTDSSGNIYNWSLLKEKIKGAKEINEQHP